MCGIFGIYEQDSNQPKTDTFYNLGKFSESRGKEASGICVIENDKTFVTKYSDKFSNSQVRNLLSKNKDSKNLTLVGHTRLETSGSNKEFKNNQPIESENVIVLHNGIITNFEYLNKKYDFTENVELDSYVINELIEKNLNSTDLKKTIIDTFKELYGEVSVFIYFKKLNLSIIYTNTGSIYYTILKNKISLFSSEEWITKKFARNDNIYKLEPGNGMIINSDSEIIDNFNAKVSGDDKLISLDNIRENLRNQSYLEPQLERCTRCILPSTFPFIKFDEDGVCNICLNYKNYELDNIDKLNQKLGKYENLIVGFSGGRDSSYGLYLINKKYEKNIIAVSYDWGMVTDLARRNQARVCGKLGIEHVWLSADIQKKRNNIKKNMIAWLKKPHIGMLPILMAGDKVWQQQLKNASKNKNNSCILQFQSPYEATFFKHGFANIKPDFPKMKTFSKVKLLFFYFYNFLINPYYWNLSLIDTFQGFISFYFRKSEFIYPYKFYKFDEMTIEKELSEYLNWEFDPTTGTSWRIGDGTSPFYNYVYWVYAGFTENDSFRSYQIREGVISREEALDMVKIENIPRFDRIREYLDLIDLDYEFVMQQIEKIKDKSLVKEWK